MKRLTSFLLALALIVTAFFSLSATSFAATMPSCTGQKVSNRTESSLRFDFTIKNPSRVSVPQCGVQIRPKGGNWSTHTENIVAKHRTLASCPVWYEVGKGKEFNYTINKTTTYELRGFCKYGGKTYYSGIATSPGIPNPVTKPSVTNCKATNVAYNGFKLEFTINNPSKVSIPECGARIRRKTASNPDKWTDWTTKSESIVSNHRTLASIPAWYQVGSGKEFNYSISANTTYQIQGYCKYNGSTFWSNTATFTTPKIDSLTDKINRFIGEGGYTENRWKNGIVWGPNQRPKSAKFNGTYPIGCAAYCADFVKEVFGIDNQNNQRSGTRFVNAKDIRVGDVIHVYYSDNDQHWFAVIGRSGNSLRTAEGSVVKKNSPNVVYVGNWYEITNDGRIYDKHANRYWPLKDGYHH